VPPLTRRKPLRSHAVGERGGVLDDLLLIRLEFRLQRLVEADRLAGDDVFQRSALDAGEHLRINLLGVFFRAENQAAARAAQRLVRRGRHEIRMADRAGMNPGRDHAGDVRDVREQQRADFVGDLAHALEINDARIGAGADGDHLRLVFARQRRELVVINPLVPGADAVVDDLEKPAGEIRLVAVREMAAMGQIHRQHLVAGLEHGEINGHVRLAAGVRLDVGVFRAEQFFRAVNGELLHDVNVFAAAVPALSWDSPRRICS
jgi:hypothetical protein